MTQSAVSQQIALLEGKLGQRLFLRQNRRVELTNAGLAYQTAVEQALSKLAANTEEIFSPTGSGNLSVESNLAFSTLWLAPRLYLFARQFPEIQINLLHANWQSQFQDNSADISVMHGNGNWQGRHAEQLFKPRLTAFCSKKTATQIHQPEDLLKFPLVDIRGNDTTWRHALSQFKLKETNTQAKHQTDNAHTAAVLCAAGNSIMLSYQEYFTGHKNVPALVAPLEQSINTPETYYLTWQNNKPLTSSGELFKDWLLAQL